MLSQAEATGETESTNALHITLKDDILAIAHGSSLSIICGGCSELEAGLAKLVEVGSWVGEISQVVPFLRQTS